MRYLILNGSPHKGNTWKLVELARENIRREDPQATFEEIHLAQENLPFCLGCSVCFRLGQHKCPHGGTVGRIMEAIDRADGVIVASSTYNRRETALLKNLFDHLSFLLHRPRFFHGKALVLTTTGGVGAAQAAKSISSFLLGIGFNRCYRFSASAYSWNDYHVSNKTAAKLVKVCTQFHKDVSSRRLHSPSSLVLIPYNLFRGMSLAYGPGSEYETEDGVHWTAPERHRGVYDRRVPVPFYKRPFGQLFYALGKVAGGKVMVTYKK